MQDSANRMQWPLERFDAVASRSTVLHGNRSVLPVAGWILDSGVEAVSASDVYRGLSGAIPPNKALEALARLGEIGALAELPYPGRPHARMFQRRASAYWDLVGGELSALQRDPATKVRDG